MNAALVIALLAMVAFAHAAEIPYAGKLPIQPDRAHEGRTGELVVVDVVDLDPADIDVAQDHVGFAAALKRVGSERRGTQLLPALPPSRLPIPWPPNTRRCEANMVKPHIPGSLFPSV
jgi:hypothetical protein